MNKKSDGAEHRAFMAAVLRDLEALDRMIGGGMIESGVRRIGAEQEMVLVDRDRRPSPAGYDVVTAVREGLGDRRVTCELARFNAEANSTPFVVGPGMLRGLEDEIVGVLGVVRGAAAGLGCEPVLAGIVPSVELRDLGQPNISPKDRYYELDRVIRSMRGRDFEIALKGADELTLHFPSVMLEALNTSFQVHLQISAEESVGMYNLAQLLAGPVLAASVNSPLLLGRRLWQETRIAIFQHAVDTRRMTGPHRDLIGRVRFGDGWIEGSVSEVFRTDVARFRLFFGVDDAEDPFAALDAGRAPSLDALALHNGTVYRWNRVCYGRTGGKPHLRIENRYLPSGPTVLDEVSNAALWIGAMLGAKDEIGDPSDRFEFDDASANFLRAARHGLETSLRWFDGKSMPAQELLLKRIVPMARRGLAGVGLGDEEIGRYMGVIEARVESGRTGARWQLDSFAAITKRVRRGRAVVGLTAALAERSLGDEPVHTWEPVGPEACGSQPMAYQRVGQFMSTNLYTVHEDELLDLALRIMVWRRIRHVLVEDDEHRLVGVISWRQMLESVTGGPREETHRAVSEIMQADPVTAAPDTTAIEAVGLMREHDVSALPVVDDGRLVGIVTEHDFARIAGELLEEQHRVSGGASGGAAGVGPGGSGS